MAETRTGGDGGLLRRALATIGLAAAILALWAGPAAAATFTVNRAGDAPDANIANAACDSNGSQAGNQCTLRAAIQEANDTLGPDAINFNIGGTQQVKTIAPASPLPTIADAVTIDGYSQNGASPNTLVTGNNAVIRVQLSGADAGAQASGLTISASGCVIRGLAINRFAGGNTSGIDIIGGATANRVEGNRLGTNAAGTAALGNSSAGVSLGEGTGGNTVGGTAAGARNVISGNIAQGIFVLSDGNTIQGNYIGTNAAGTADLGNGNIGVLVRGDGNTIGGTAAGARNVISGNEGEGILVSSSSNNTIQGNRVGTSAVGTADLGNGRAGVVLDGALSGGNNTVGGAATGARNVISGNGSNGVVLREGTGGDAVIGNYIGTTADGTGALGNTFNGVDIRGSSGNSVGGTANGSGNRIAHNGGAGVEITDSGGFSPRASHGNRVLSNSIHSNGGLGIDLDPFGVTANDAGDADTGFANRMQNFPVITSARRSRATGITTILGTLDSNPSQSYTIQCFLAAPDPTGHGEGRVLLGQTTATTDAGGDGSFACLSPVPASRQTVTATATNTATGDTSEFSRVLPVTVTP